MSTPHTPTSRSAKAMAERRQRILDAAVELFQRKGFLGATTDEIADAAGVTKRTLYRHVGSKHRLLRSIHDDFIDEGLRRWQEVASRDLNAREMLEELIRVHILTVAEYQKQIGVFFEEWKHLEPDDRDEIIERRDAYEAILQSTLRRGMTDGTFRKMDVRGTTLLVLGALTEVYRWYKPNGAATPEQLGDIVVELVLSGIQKAA